MTYMMDMDMDLVYLRRFSVTFASPQGLTLHLHNTTLFKSNGLRQRNTL